MSERRKFHRDADYSVASGSQTRGDKSARLKARSEASARSRYRTERERSVIRRNRILSLAASSEFGGRVGGNLRTGNSGRTRVFDASAARAEVGEEMDGKERAEKGGWRGKERFAWSDAKREKEEEDRVSRSVAG